MRARRLSAFEVRLGVDFVIPLFGIDRQIIDSISELVGEREVAVSLSEEQIDRPRYVLACCAVGWHRLERHVRREIGLQPRIVAGDRNDLTVGIKDRHPRDRHEARQPAVQCVAVQVLQDIRWNGELGAVLDIADTEQLIAPVADRHSGQVGSAVV